MTRLEKKLLSAMARASSDFALLEPNDHVMVCVSGGKDSHAMLYLLREIAKKTPFALRLTAVNLDQGQPGFPKDTLPSYFEREGYDYEIVTEDTYSIVMDKVPAGKTYCSLCSRLRRGVLYNTAERIGATKIALGHHRDDVIETFLLNILYSGQTKSMPPKLLSDDGRNVVIRPLVYCAEEDIAAFAQRQGFPIIPCDLCGSQDNLQRKRVKALVASLAADNPNVKGNIFAALGNVRPTHLLDAELRRSLGITTAREEAVAGDSGAAVVPLARVTARSG